MQRKYLNDKNLIIEKIEYIPPTPEPESLSDGNKIKIKIMSIIEK